MTQRSSFIRQVLVAFICLALQQQQRSFGMIIRVKIVRWGDRFPYRCFRLYRAPRISLAVIWKYFFCDRWSWRKAFKEWVERYRRFSAIRPQWWFPGSFGPICNIPWKPVVLSLGFLLGGRVCHFRRDRWQCIAFLVNLPIAFLLPRPTRIKFHIICRFPCRKEQRLCLKFGHIPLWRDSTWWLS